MKPLRQNFLGEFEEEKYVIKKCYLEVEGRNVRLYHTRLTPFKPERTLCIIHGFGQHSGRFLEVADFFAKKGYQVLLVDLTGFGYSGGARGCATMDILQNDVMTVLSQANPELPLFLYAHSLGGLTAIKLLLERPMLKISGCIVTSPLLGFPKDRKFQWFKIWAVKQVGDDLEDLIINSMVNPTALTKNNKFLQTIFEDRLMIPFLSVKMAKSIFESIEFVKEKMNNFNFPVIIFHGKKDSITNYEDSKSFVYTKVASFKQIHLFNEGFHELQHDQQRDQMLERAFKFMDTLPSSYIKSFGTFDLNKLKILRKKKGISKVKVILIGIIIFIVGYLIKKYKK